MQEFLQSMGSMAPMLLLFVVAYLFFIRPQVKKQKQEVNFTKEVKKGDKVVTKSGMHGKIVEINDTDNTCVIETSAGKIKFERTALSLELSNKLKK
ncbi:preprotein translocase subunit YajC [Pseudofulvibacter geojedonensis]|uniref:Sec translocon accessory complex subunit YajC n=1 Tax=Pseudofulvibacter geojedonensis TaxID=1123758 RepID=A0ABW3I261_9FLAO